MKVAIVNYGMGNLGSVRRALEDLHVAPFVAEHPTALFDANRLILPGVGSFAEGMRRLHAGGWVPVIRQLVLEAGRPMLGICLGMHLLANQGEEGGVTEGLGLIDGTVKHLEALGCALRIPHIGWNDLTFAWDEFLFDRIPQHSDFYFVHSYAFTSEQSQQAIAHTVYGTRIVAAIRNGHVLGVQFHPEKSSKAGRQLLRNFLEFAPC